ncbi:cupin domain-containing protein [Arthrobacter sp. KNU-44]|uniref:cupin domain-containing protein n=1 Tax=Arthrobacter sp. KNU-44 TaxID=3450744 RepID=UPI003F4441EC
MVRKPEGATASGHEAIGPQIRVARLADGRSLRQLASEVGVSASLLSQVENGKVQPSVATLYALVSALGVSVDSVLGVANENQKPGQGVSASPEADKQTPSDALWTDTRIVVQRRNENPTLDMDNGVRWERLSGSNDELEILLVTYQAGASSSIDGKLMRHSGHEFAYLIEGNLTVQIGFDVFEVEAGDSFNFDSTLPHMYINRSDNAARGIWYSTGRRSDLPAALFPETHSDASVPEPWRLPVLEQ